MIAEIFTALLITSFAGACLAAVLLLARPLTKQAFGYAWHYYIWLTVLLVMLLPVHFSLPQMAGGIPLVSPEGQVKPMVQAGQGRQPASAVPALQTDPGETFLQTGAGILKNAVDSRLHALAYLWIAGAMLLLTLRLISYIRLLIRIRKASAIVPCPALADFTDKNIIVRVWEQISSPFMIGLFRPALILPARELTGAQLDNILRHEMMHYRRHDIVYKWFVVLVQCLHWFNPMVWVVGRQISIECEISCDMAVTRDMDRDEKNRYIDTLLSLLPMGTAKQIPFTTQMASGQKLLKRRFMMMKMKKSTSRLISALSAAAAIVILSATVFASGVLSGLTVDNYTVEIKNNGEKIELVNQPFIENGEVYLPLRETFAQVGYSGENSYIHWDNGIIDIAILNYPGQNGRYRLEIGKTLLELQHFQGKDLYEADALPFVMAIVEEHAPLLKNSTVYVPLETMNYMLYGFINKRNEDGALGALTYTVYAQDGSVIAQNYDSALENVEPPAESGQAPELLSWSSEPAFFSDPYSDFLTENIAQSLQHHNQPGTYNYTYITHQYNYDNDEVSFQYQIKPFGKDKVYILFMLFQNRYGSWNRYNSFIIDPDTAEVLS